MVLLPFTTIAETAEQFKGGSYNRKRNREIRKVKNIYGLESHEEYDFGACQKYKKEDEKPDYFISCVEGELIYDDSFDKLTSATMAIESKVYKDNLLNELKDHSIKELDKNITNLDMIKTCIEIKTSGLTPGQKCKELLPSILNVVKVQLPQLRATMSLMNKPRSFQRSRVKPKDYQVQIKHEVPTTKVPYLTKKEQAKIKEETEAIRFGLQQDWYEENSKKNGCIEQLSPRSYRFKPSKTQYSCASVNQAKLDRSVKSNMGKLRSKLKENYFKLISTNPILAHLNLTGEEDNEKILSEVQTVISKLLSDANKSKNKLNSLTKDELPSLITNDNIVNSYLKKKGPSEALCDVSQDFKDEEDFNELKNDLFLAGGALIGGGICAFTAGIGCIIGVGLATEVVGVTVAHGRYEDAAISFNAGLSSAEQYNDRKFERDFALLLAPVSVAGEFIGSGVRIGRKAFKNSPSGKSYDTDMVGIYKKEGFRQRTSLLKEPPKNKKDMIGKYENFILVPPKLNARWIDIAKSDNAGLYLDVENAALKRLNDTIGDKSFVTALTNVHKDILSTKVNKLLTKYPGVDIEVYSDFKSVRYAFKPKDMPPELKSRLQKDLDSTYKEANTEFANMVKTMDGVPDTEHPDQWFQGGLGLTADQAGQSAKKARDLSRPAQLTSFGEIKNIIEGEAETITNYSRSLTKDHPLAKANLTEAIPGTGENTVALPVFEVIRKVKSPSRSELEVYQATYLSDTGVSLTHIQASERLMSVRLANELNTKFGSELLPAHAKELLNYSSSLDSLTPGLWVKERVSANLNEAKLGGMSGDVTGMGARNIRQVAYDIAKTTKGSAEEVLSSTRKGEQAVTQTFDEIKNNFKVTVKDVLDKRGIKYSDPCSGDDCVMIPSSKLSAKDENALVNAFAKQDNPSQYRLSFIPEGVSSADRTNLAVHGELVEKELRKRLIGVGEGKISYDKLSQITVATKMPKQIKSGDVGLILGVGKDSPLSKAEKELLESHLSSAVKKVNEALAKESPNTKFSYGAGKVDWLD